MYLIRSVVLEPLETLILIVSSLGHGNRLSPSFRISSTIFFELCAGVFLFFIIFVDQMNSPMWVATLYLN